MDFLTFYKIITIITLFCQYLLLFFLTFGKENTMTTDKTKLIMVIEKDLLERVDDFRFENRIPTRAEAVRHLIRDGLQYNKDQSAAQGKKPGRK